MARKAFKQICDGALGSDGRTSFQEYEHARNTGSREYASFQHSTGCGACLFGSDAPHIPECVTLAQMADDGCPHTEAA